MPGGRLRLCDLLAHEVLGLELVDPVEMAVLDRTLAGAHPIEVDAPSQWLAPGWVVLTTGVRLRNRPDAQRQLVRELAGAGIAALGFAVGVVYSQTPTALRDEARALGLPVFEVPFETPLREIVAFVHGSLVSKELFMLRRAASMQRFLFDAVADADGECELVGRLASLLDCSAVLMGRDGQAIAAHGQAPVRELWAAMRTGTGGAAEFRCGEWLARAAPVESQGEVSKWLVLATRRRAAFPPVAETLHETTARLLAVLACGQRAAEVEERARRAVLLDDLMTGGCRRNELADRLRAFGFSPGASLQVYALAGEPGAELAPAAAAAAVDARLPYLVTGAGAGCLLLVEEHGEALALTESLRARAPWVKLGASRRSGDVLAIPQLVREATTALDYGRRQGGAGGTWYFEDLDLVGLALATQSSTEMAAKAAQTLAPLEANTQLLSTLVTYFDAQLDVGRTAGRLHLHPNSLRYRLAQIEKLLGLDMRRPATITNLYLALGYARLRGDAARVAYPDGAPERAVTLAS
ncbi:MAG TPA: PucR family transcriptional regulator [Solirubrobacter sp.]|nr:PucR family transcriptional regulator [Solirubrobacter sp.]